MKKIDLAEKLYEFEIAYKNELSSMSTLLTTAIGAFIAIGWLLLLQYDFSEMYFQGHETLRYFLNFIFVGGFVIFVIFILICITHTYRGVTGYDYRYIALTDPLDLLISDATEDEIDDHAIEVLKTCVRINSANNESRNRHRRNAAKHLRNAIFVLAPLVLLFLVNYFYCAPHRSFTIESGKTYTIMETSRH